MSESTVRSVDRGIAECESGDEPSWTPIFKLPSELRYHEVPEEGGMTVIGAGQNPKRGAYNIDISPNVEKGVFYGDANNLNNIASNSQSKVIIENPYGFSPYNNEINRIIEPGGTLRITGTESNKYFFKGIGNENIGYEEITKGIMPDGYTKILKAQKIAEELRKQGFQNNGDLIKKATDLEIELQK